MSLFYALFSKYVPERRRIKDFFFLFLQPIGNKHQLSVIIALYHIFFVFMWKEKNRLLNEINLEASVL